MLKGVEKWRSLVASELHAAGIPLPPEHILSLMYRESRGNPAAISIAGAMGLLQVMPVSLNWYNKHHRVRYSVDQFRNSPQAQIKVGIWILSQFMQSVFKYLKKRIGEVALDDLVRITDLWYATGPGNAKPRLDRITPTWPNIASTYPDWDRVKPAELVWTRANDEGATWDLSSINDWLSTNIINDKTKAAGGAAIALLVIAAAWLYLRKASSE